MLCRSRRRWCVCGRSLGFKSFEKNSDGRVDCDHVSGLFTRFMTAGPDGVRDEISIELQAKDPEVNRLRSWHVEAGPDLFGVWIAKVRFGRIGTVGTVLHGGGSRKCAGARTPNPICYLSDTDIVRASERQHSVQRSGSDGNLGRLGLAGARSKRIADHALVPAD
jgi:hypothetical protein